MYPYKIEHCKDCKSVHCCCLLAVRSCVVQHFSICF